MNYWIVPAGCQVGVAEYMGCAVVAMFLIGVSKGGFGSGVGMLATPLLVSILPPNTALAMILFLLISCDLATLRKFPRKSDWDKRSLLMLAPGVVVGLLVGRLFIGRFEPRWLNLAIGVVAIGFGVLPAVGDLAARLARRDPSWGTGAILGLLAGFTTMVAHAAGPIVVMFFLARHLDQRRFVGTCARYFLTFNLVKVPLFVIGGQAIGPGLVTWETLRWVLWLLPFAPVSVALGAWMNRRLSAKTFTTIVYGLLALTGLKLIYGATLGFAG